MEPFYLRCETCQARLRVRDERFLGQVQSCPKCGSMVHILAPAVDVPPAPEAAATTAAATTVGVRVLAALQEHSRWWIAAAAATSAVGGLAVFLALRGNEPEVAAPPPAVPVVAERIATPVEEVKQVLPPALAVNSIEPAAPIPPPASIPPPRVEHVETVAVAAVVAPPPLDVAPAVRHERPRTLTLEPVDVEPSATTATVEAVPDYSRAMEAAEAQPTEAISPASRPPVRVTNIVDQLAVPIESIELPPMPIGEFVNLVSGMAAVPIQLDAKVLGDVGLSSRSTVTVSGESTTIGKLLARVLKEHQLTCIEQDGKLVVVRAKR